MNLFHSFFWYDTLIVLKIKGRLIMRVFLWFDSISNFFINYWNGIEWESIFSNLFTKLLSLVILFLLFYLGKKLAHFLFKKTILSSMRVSTQSESRKKTILKLLENMLDYFLYFILDSFDYRSPNF